MRTPSKRSSSLTLRTEGKRVGVATLSGSQPAPFEDIGHALKLAADDRTVGPVKSDRITIEPGKTLHPHDGMADRAAPDASAASHCQLEKGRGVCIATRTGTDSAR
jgi:hypothetical protein